MKDDKNCLTLLGGEASADEVERGEVGAVGTVRARNARRPVAQDWPHPPAEAGGGGGGLVALVTLVHPLSRSSVQVAAAVVHHL